MAISIFNNPLHSSGSFTSLFFIRATAADRAACGDLRRPGNLTQRIAPQLSDKTDRWVPGFIETPG